MHILITNTSSNRNPTSLAYFWNSEDMRNLSMSIIWRDKLFLRLSDFLFISSERNKKHKNERSYLYFLYQKISIYLYLLLMTCSLNLKKWNMIFYFGKPSDFYFSKRFLFLFLRFKDTKRWKLRLIFWVA